MTDITDQLNAVRAGDDEALQIVFETVYAKLKNLAAARLSVAAGNSTLSRTELVHEAYLRLSESHRLELENRRHFFACAARAMRLRTILDDVETAGHRDAQQRIEIDRTPIQVNHQHRPGAVGERRGDGIRVDQE